MVDIHCHILPGVDDGPKTWGVALQMLEMAARDGIQHVVASPHSNADFSYGRNTHAESLNLLKQRSTVAVEFSLGCDFHFSFENIESALRDASQFCIGSTPYLLIEFSNFGIPPNAKATLLRFLEKGIVPIITHPERNPRLVQNLVMVRSLVELGCLVQITANSITGYWGEAARTSSFKLLDQSLVHVVATDAHNLESRPPILSEARDAIRTRYSDELANALCVTIPGAIVSGKTLPRPFLTRPDRLATLLGLS
jgi:protein-tyrosine phosphatase